MRPALSEMSPDQPRTKPVRVRPVPAVSRSIAILRLLGRQKQAMGVKAIADELGLVPSTCLHILRVLVSENLVKQEAGTKRYMLGSGMVSLARSVLDGAGFASLVQPALDRLAAKHGITAMGAELTARHTILVLAVSRPDQPLQLHADIGGEFSDLTSATGRLVAAFDGYGPDKLRAMFPSIHWDRPLTFEEWSAEVDEAHRNGWSMDCNRFKDGITTYAVPVLSQSGAITHSIFAMGLSAEMQRIDADTLVGDMQYEAALIVRGMTRVRTS